MTCKESDRLYYDEDGNNRYSPPEVKPPRRNDPRNRHQKKDELEIEDEKKEKQMESSNNEKEAAKRIARKRFKTAGRPALSDSGFDQKREGLENYRFKDKGIRAIAKTYKNLADSFLNMTKAVNTFTSCKSSEISPDGKLGGKGYIQPIKGIRSAMADCQNLMSELLDTFHDEVNSPYWKKTTVDDHPIVKEILEKADDLIDKAEDLDGQIDPKDPEKVVLSDGEKSKVLNILKDKGHI
ncbi:hypothetical protein N9948_01130 [bacterium]|nr:hypothetical protein [bacterium]